MYSPGERVLIAEKVELRVSETLYLYIIDYVNVHANTIHINVNTESQYIG